MRGRGLARTTGEAGQVGREPRTGQVTAPVAGHRPHRDTQGEGQAGRCPCAGDLGHTRHGCALGDELEIRAQGTQGATAARPASSTSASMGVRGDQG